MQRTLEEITQYIDHTLLKPYASKEAMQAFCNEEGSVIANIIKQEVIMGGEIWFIDLKAGMEAA